LRFGRPEDFDSLGNSLGTPRILATTTRTQTIHSSNCMSGKKARARKEKRERGRDANAGDAFTRLPNHLVVTHILRSEYFDDPADLARLPAVSRAMRDLVAETGLRFKELDEKRAVELGCVSAVQRRQRQGRLSRQELLCQAAVRSGQLEELKVLRADGWPWDRDTCSATTLGGHLKVHSGRARKAARGTYARAIKLRRAGI
jgi:hypothetical protein